MTALSTRPAPTPVKAVVFDFDGTVVDTETPVFESWRKTYEENGVPPLSRAQWRAHIGTTSQPFDPADELERRFVELNVPFDRERVIAQRLALRNELLAEVSLRPGIEEWVDAAERHRIGIAIASNSPIEWVDEQLRRVGLRHRFTVVSCAGSGVPGKPNPAVYLRACSQLGVSPADSIAVEDSPVGAEAAAMAGMFVVVVPGPMTTGLRFEHADREVSALVDLSPDDWLPPCSGEQKSPSL